MHCEICKRDIPGSSWDSHEQGKKHQKNLEAWKALHCVVFVSKLKRRITASQLHNYFSTFGTVEAVKLHTHRHSATVTYSSDKAAEHALSQHHHQLDNHVIRVVRHQPYNTLPQSPEPKKTDSSLQELKLLWEKLNHVDSIDAQMTCLMQEWALTEKRHNEIITCVQTFQAAIQAVIPEACLHPFGSVVTGLGSVNSDLDVVLQFVPHEHDLHCQPVLPKRLRGLVVENGFITFKSLQELPPGNMCRVVMEILRTSLIKKFLTHFISLSTARKPVLKFHYLSANLDVDMTFQSTLSLRNTKLIKVLLELDDRVRPLIFTLRLWIKLAGFCDNQATRVTNYALFLLLYFYLENTEPRVLPTVEQLYQLASDNDCPKTELEGWDCTFVDDVDMIRQSILPHLNTQSLTDLLGGFFSFYAKLDLLSVVICPRTGIVHDVLQFIKTVNTCEKLKPFKFTYICLQDPFDLSHNTLANVSQKYAYHFCRCLQETNTDIEQNTNCWNLMTILPKHPVTSIDEILPLKDPLAAILPFVASNLPQVFWDCGSVEDAQIKWHQCILHVLLQCLDAWRITCTSMTDLDVSGSLVELKRKGEKMTSNDLKRLMLGDPLAWHPTEITDQCQDLPLEESSISCGNVSSAECAVSSSALSASFRQTSSCENPTTSFNTHTTESGHRTSQVQSISSDKPVTSLCGSVISTDCPFSSQFSTISDKPSCPSAFQAFSSNNTFTSSPNVTTSSVLSSVAECSSTSSENCDRMQCPPNQSSPTGRAQSKYSSLQRSVHQKMSVHCETLHRLWLGRKQAACTLKAHLQKLSVIDTEKLITAKLLEQTTPENKTVDKLMFDICLERVSYGHRIQMEIYVEAAKEKSQEIAQFKSFMHGYGCKVLKNALEFGS